MGNPGLLQALPDIAALLPQGGGDGEQPAAPDGAAGGLDTMADLAVNHRSLELWLARQLEPPAKG